MDYTDGKTLLNILKPKKGTPPPFGEIPFDEIIFEHLKSSSSEKVKSVNHEGKNKKKPKPNKTNKAKLYRGTEEYLSYVSSSAHTGGSVTESIANENNYTISTVNTSDINMISE